MPLTKRIIPCLDVDQGRVVKGVKFVNIRDAGDPVEIAKRYGTEGADEIAFLDITASSGNRNIIIDVVERVADEIFIPMIVGGGIQTVQSVRDLLGAGADKVSINTAAINDPDLIARAANKVGSQCITLAIDAKHSQDSTADHPHWEVYTHGGRRPTGIDALAWAEQMVATGAGEILLTSMDRDGTKIGFDLALTKAVSSAVPVPVIASGGVGTLEHLYEGITKGGADAVLAASIFHFQEHSIEDAKRYLRERQVSVRL